MMHTSVVLKLNLKGPGYTFLWPSGNPAYDPVALDNLVHEPTYSTLFLSQRRIGRDSPPQSTGGGKYPRNYQFLPYPPLPCISYGASLLNSTRVFLWVATSWPLATDEFGRQVLVTWHGVICDFDEFDQRTCSSLANILMSLVYRYRLHYENVGNLVDTVAKDAQVLDQLVSTLVGFSYPYVFDVTEYLPRLQDNLVQVPQFCNLRVIVPYDELMAVPLLLLIMQTRAVEHVLGGWVYPQFATRNIYASSSYDITGLAAYDATSLVLDATNISSSNAIQSLTNSTVKRQEGENHAPQEGSGAKRRGNEVEPYAPVDRSNSISQGWLARARKLTALTFPKLVRIGLLFGGAFDLVFLLIYGLLFFLPIHTVLVLVALLNILTTSLISNLIKQKYIVGVPILLGMVLASTLLGVFASVNIPFSLMLGLLHLIACTLLLAPSSKSSTEDS